MGLQSEIREQPDILAGLLEQQAAQVEQIAARIRERDIHMVFLAGRGTSDHAGLYAKYLMGTMNRLPVAMATPSVFSVYGQPPVLKNALVIGISQSGQSPDIVSVLAEAKRQGQPTLAITNEPESLLAQEADFLIDIQAGQEKAVAATKTYTAELMSIAMLAVALKGDGDWLAALRRVPNLVRQALELDDVIADRTERYRYMTRCVVLGRGYNYATVFEWSLKLEELTYVVAEPYSSADFRHGPIAIIGPGFPVLAVAPDGAIFPDLQALLERLVKDYHAEILAISNREEALRLAHVPIRLPSDLPEWLSPLVAIIPAQLFCLHLTRAKGFDTESPRGLSKVTETR
jgi:glucosamine--fructose-6-phosphate aminotransferase (isomerizing)